MGKKKLKQPSLNSGNKIKPYTSDETPPQQSYMLISLRYLDPEFCITKCNKNEKSSFAEKVRMLTQKQWKEIAQLPRHGLGYEKIDRLLIKRPIPSQITDDCNIIAFRYSGKAPMVGYREGNVFYVVWFDSKFKLYKH